ncbi:8-amino-7-oxononanoate synthase [bacterium]|nr:MAG: 8-amino-7-oxononanoate synthase [bacterium]
MFSYSDELEKLDRAGLKRNPRVITGPQGARVIVDNKPALQLSSNDYLGLASNPLLKEAAIKSIEKYGTGAGASRLVTGTMDAHIELEEKIKSFTKAPSALLFNSGYNANLSCITALAGRATEVFSDKLNHASIIDACVLSRAKLTRFLHADVNALERALKKSVAKKKIIITEGVFSMEGTVAPLGEMAMLAKKHGALFIIDDAHGFGVLGQNGRGVLEYCGAQLEPFMLCIATLGKAVGSFGAFAVGEKEIIDLLVSKARPFIFTTALPPAVCAASIKALEIMATMPELRRRLWENIAFLKKGLASAGVGDITSKTQILPLIVGSADKTMQVSAALLEKGVFIQGIRPPTVPENTSRLRITVSAVHSREDLSFALTAIKEAFSEIA